MNVAARIPTKSEFSKDALVLDAAAEVERIVEALRKQVLGAFGRRGAVVGLSGGIDSSVVAALCVHAFGNDKVLGVFMPEHHSSDDSLRLGRSWAAQLGISTVLEDISPALEGLGAYRRQIEAIRTEEPVETLDEEAQLICRVADEISRDVRLSDEALEAITERYGAREAAGLILLVSYYNMVSRFLESTRVELESEPLLAGRTFGS